MMMSDETVFDSLTVATVLFLEYAFPITQARCMMDDLSRYIYRVWVGKVVDFIRNDDDNHYDDEEEQRFEVNGDIKLTLILTASLSNSD
jgi:hypothetical protein